MGRSESAASPWRWETQGLRIDETPNANSFQGCPYSVSGQRDGMPQGRFMSKENTAIRPWSPPEVVVIPANSSPDEMVEFAHPQLSIRDMKSIVSAFSA